ncbi:MAG: ASKHA domain-containing protein [Bacillota bacterium]
MEHTITVYQKTNQYTISKAMGNNLLKLLQDEGFKLASPCGGVGICGKCKVKFLSESPPPVDEEKKLLTATEIEKGVRLACFHSLQDDLELEIPETGDMEILTGGLVRELEFDPRLQWQQIELEAPSLADQTDYLQRIREIVGIDGVNSRVLSRFNSLKENDKLNLILDEDDLIDLRRPETTRGLYGLAIDIGTTTIAIYLLDLITGAEIDVYSLANPQQVFGADVISRINYTTSHEQGIEELQARLVEGLNSGIRSLLKENNLKQESVYQTSIVGNTVILHTLLAIKAETIARSPYVPIFTEGLELVPDELGLEMNNRGFVQLLPSVSGYIGADIVGDILVTEFDNGGWNLLIDIGTNGEIVLGKGQEMYACSAAAGPAFEGAKITHGLAGVPGAISSFEEDSYQTIGNEKPRGICGSGLLDIIEVLLERDLVDKTGALKDKNLSPEQQQLIVEYNDQKAFQVVPAADSATGEDIVLTQKDIREFQLAKGAIAAGIQILVEEAEIVYEQIKNVYLAGGFGNFIGATAACRVGLIPAPLEERIVRIGNGAGLGAKAYLLDKKQEARTQKIKQQMTYLELSKMTSFQSYFMENMVFEPIKD